MKTLTKKSKKTSYLSTRIVSVNYSQYTTKELIERKSELLKKIEKSAMTGFYNQQFEIINDLLDQRFAQKAA